MKVQISLIFLILVSISPTFSQNQREILTNAKIIELVKLDLGESVIVEKIRRSECRCDTSTTELAKLKAAKVSDNIIMAMMNPSTGGYSESTPPAGSNRANDTPVRVTVENGATKSGASESMLRQITEPGIYLFENGKMTLIEPTVYSGSKSNFFKTAISYGLMKSKIRASVRGKSANTQATSRRPEFYFVFSREFGNAGAVMSGFGGYAATSPNEFMMIAMKVKENTREATLGEFNAYSTSTGAKDSEIREYSFEKLKPGLYRVVPKVDLATGEYCFYYAGNAGSGGKVFDFSVR